MDDSALRQAVAQLNLVVAQLSEQPVVPVRTVAAHVPSVILRCSVPALLSYRPHLLRLIRRWGPRPLTDLTAADLAQERDIVKGEAAASVVGRARRRGRTLLSWDLDAHGHCAAGHFVHACRFAFRLAVEDGLLTRSPAAGLRMPDRAPGPERPLERWELEQIWDVAATTGNDPDLDVQILTLARHTAARREGLLNLTMDAFDLRRGTVTLSEKYGKTREMPLHRAVIQSALGFALSRGAADPDDAVLRYANGTPITRRRFMTLFDRIDAHTEWSERLDVGVHWIRHTTLADIASIAGLRIASAYAGHSDAALGVIGTYTKVPPSDLRAAYHAAFGPEPANTA